MPSNGHDDRNQAGMITELATIAFNKSPGFGDGRRWEPTYCDSDIDMVS